MDKPDSMETIRLENEESDSLTPRRKETVKLKRKFFDCLKKISTKRTKTSVEHCLNSKLESKSDIKYKNTTNITEIYEPFSLCSPAYLSSDNNNFATVMLDTSNLPTLTLSMKYKNQDMSNATSLSHETDVTDEKYDGDINYSSHQCKHNNDDFCAYRDPSSNNITDVRPSPILKELLDLALHFQESEVNLKHVIEKFVQDQNAAKDILQTISSHVDLKIRIERQSYAYTKEMVSEQVEISKAKELTLQDSINFLTNINKAMQVEMEILQKENENLNDNSKTDSKNQSEIDESDSYLHDKLLKALKQFKNLQEELQNVKSQNKSLESQLAEANDQIDNYKDLLDKTDADFEMKYGSLYKQMESNKKKIKECFEAGTILTKDMKSLATQLQSTTLIQNWPNLKWCGTSIVDLIHISRTCINELGRELFNLNNQLNICYKENIEKNEQHKSLKSEHGVNDEPKKEIDRTLHITNNFANLKSQITRKESEISKLETDLQNCLTENLKLKQQVDYMQLILKSSDMYKELQGPYNKSIYSQKNDQLTNTITVKDRCCKTEDKEVSCQLRDAANDNEQLKEKLAAERQRIKQISAAKVMIEEQASSNLQEFQKMLIAEREAMRELIKEHKHLTDQRNYLLSLNTGNISQMENLKANLSELHVLNEQIDQKYQSLVSQYDELSNELELARKIVDIEEVTSKNKFSDYEMKISERDNIIRQLKCEREGLQNSIRYLQCTTKKLHNEVNTLRSVEKDYKKKTLQSSESVIKFLRTIEQLENLLGQSMSEKKLLEEKVNAAISKYNSLLTEYNTFTKGSKEVEENLKNEVRTYKKENENISKDLESVIRDSNANRSYLEEHEKQNQQLKQKLNEFEQVSNLLFEKSTLLEESLENQQQLEFKLTTIITEHSQCYNKADKLSSIIKNLEKEIGEVKNKRDKEFESCSNIVDNLIIENRHKEKYWKNNLHDAISKLKELRTKYSIQTRSFMNIKSKYQNLVKSMDSVINLVTQENSFTEIIQTIIVKIKQDVRDINVQVKTIIVCMVRLTSETVYIEQKVERFAERENEMQGTLNYTRKICLEGKQECENMRWNLELSKEKLKKLKEMPFLELDYIHKEIDLKDELIKRTEEHLHALQNRLAQIKDEVLRKNAVILELKAELSIHYQKMQILEFQKCELTLRLHEKNCKLNAEMNLNMTLKESHQHLLESICKISIEHPRALPAKSMLSITETENCSRIE